MGAAGLFGRRALWLAASVAAADVVRRDARCRFCASLLAQRA
ncbi:hypothetical protein BURMUCF1_A1638 [Burkholderia multivorans ATCC BAA-247]|nr:hypothetical protein BURMUCF1_A1638 [Burkholderia multivorans ATCC BAA-247]